MDTDALCGYEETSTGDPCEHKATNADGRCWFHSEVESESGDGRATSKTFKTAPETLDRLHSHKRPGETNTAVLNRALDALDREHRLPEAVTEVLRA